MCCVPQAEKAYKRLFIWIQQEDQPDEMEGTL